jgi:hypothetical protein
MNTKYYTRQRKTKPTHNKTPRYDRTHQEGDEARRERKKII